MSASRRWRASASRRGVAKALTTTMLAPRHKLWSTPGEGVALACDMLELTSADTVYDVGCGDGRFVTTAVQKLGAERGYGLDIDAELVKRAQDLASRRGVGHRTTFLACDCSQPSPDVWKILDECTLLIMYLLPEALQQVRPIIDKHLSGPMLGYV